MAKLVMFLLTFVALFIGSECSTKNYYTAAVYEHRTVNNASLSQETNLQNNLKIYIQTIKKAALKGVDIIVFPEYGLTDSLNTTRSSLIRSLPVIPDPTVKKGWVPCMNLKYVFENQVLNMLSCAAQYSNIYVAANFASKVSCNRSMDSDCPSDNYYLYNTEIVFDPNGALIARYHKKLLFMEPFFNSPKNFEFTTFQTKFGKFGIFICYDLLFKEAIELVRKHNVDSVIYSTHWPNIYPLFLAVEAQSGFARAQMVNVLAANCHDPTNGTVGSGIYSGKYGAVNYTFNTNSSDHKLLISKVPINPKKDDYVPPSFRNGETIDPRYHPYLYNLKLDAFNTTSLTGLSGTAKISQGNITCRLEYAINSTHSGGNYILGARDYIAYSIPQNPLAFKLCLLINTNKHKGAKQSVFKKIKLSGNFKKPVIDAMFPAILTRYLKLAPSHQWLYDNGTIISPNGISDPIQVVGLAARDYINDPSVVPITTAAPSQVSTQIRGFFVTNVISMLFIRYF